MNIFQAKLADWRYISVRIAALSALFMLACPTQAQRAFDIDILRDTFGYHGDVKKSVKLGDLQQGCKMKDCIRSIDEPKYVDVSSASSYLADDDLVLALSWNGENRAWPVRIMDQHEIVNDVIGGTPIAITWCPLCGSAIGVLRTIDGEVTEFGVSGLLYNSDLVFYDRRTKTLWDQIGARGIVGPLTGRRLEMVPVTMARWGQWRRAHPDTEVLSPDTGYFRDYTADPYASYRESNRLMFPVARKSSKIRPKSVVFGFDLNGEKIAFTESALDETGTIEHEFNGRTLTVTRAADGSVRLSDSGSDTVYTPVRLYWFAWYTFHPDTELVGDP